MNAGRLLVFVGAGLLGSQGLASTERLVWADVDRVEPIHRITYAVSRDLSCIQIPARSEGLAERLAWDLREDCNPRKELQVDGYRVHYRWAGRDYVHTMGKPPGEKIALKVQVDLRD